MIRQLLLVALGIVLSAIIPAATAANQTEPAAHAANKTEKAAMEFPFIYHLIQADLWQKAKTTGEAYYPPTYDQDGFTHATANPAKLLSVANHFYTDIPGLWLCLEMTVDSLAATGVKTIFEGTAPVGDIQPDFEGSDDELFPHVLGGIMPTAVLNVYAVKRAEDGSFLSIDTVVEQ